MAQAYTDRTISRDPSLQREALLRILSAAAFLVFFQSYLVASLIRSGFTISLAVFAAAQLCIGFLAIPLFSAEDSSLGDQSQIVRVGALSH